MNKVKKFLALIFFATLHIPHKVECLTAGYSIFFINDHTILITISDLHVDSSFSEIALNHAGQMADLLNFAKTLSGTNVFFNMELRESMRKRSLHTFFIGLTGTLYCDPATKKNLIQITDELRAEIVDESGDLYCSPDITQHASCGRAVYFNNQEGPISYINFDKRDSASKYDEHPEEFYKLIAALPPTEHQSFIEKCYQDAQKKINQANIDKNLKEDLLQNFKNYFDQVKKDPYCEFFIYSLESDVTLACNIIEQAHTEGVNIIFAHSGALHCAIAVCELLNIEPIKQVGVLSAREIGKALNLLNGPKKEAKEALFIDFGDQIIAELESSLKFTPKPDPSATSAPQ